MSQFLTNPRVMSFLKGEKMIFAIAAALAFTTMTVLFVLPAFISPDPGYRDFHEMTIVSRVVLPLRLGLAWVVFGTVVNAVIQFVHAIRSTQDAGPSTDAR